MYEKLSCIALRRVAYSDTKAILSAWSRERGRLSLLMPDGSGREAKRRRALTEPLALFTVEADVRPGREIHPVRDLMAMEDSPVMRPADPGSAMQRFFLSEFLEKVLRQDAPDLVLSDFLFEAVAEIARGNTPAPNYHLAFLVRLTHKLGISPDTSLPSKSFGRHTFIFDIRDAVFRATPPLHDQYVEGELARGAYLLSRMTFRNMKAFRYTRQQRRQALDGILGYYKTHLLGPATFKTLDLGL